MRFFKIIFFILLSVGLLPPETWAQNSPATQASGPLTLEQCIAYALQNRPSVKQAYIDEEITERDINVALSDWFPQVYLNGNLQHYLKMPVTIFQNEARTIGTPYTSNVSLEANQAIFDQDVIFATRGSRYARLRSDQVTTNEKINTIVTVSQAFYDLLLTQEQLKILDQDIIRQEKQLKDAFAQYEQGLVDKTDYKRAEISLGNVKSNRRRVSESLTPKYVYLKEVMGYPSGNDFQIAFESVKLQDYMLVDTAQAVTYSNRIEFQQLQNQKQIQELTVNYYKWNFLPTLSGFGNYNVVYQNNEFQQLYQQSFPNSLIGLRVSMPLFQGTRRIQNLRRAQLQQKRLDLDIDNTKNRINTEYERALATYKSELNELASVQKNVATAQEVYDIIKLQYDEGIKPYLDLILAEAEIRVTQLNYLNTLYRVLVSKLEVERATGTINVNAYEQK